MSKNAPFEIVRQQEAMIDALETHYGSIKYAAQAAGISPRTHFRWMKEYPDYERKADISRDIGYRNLKDSIIETAIRKAKKGNVQVINQMMRTFLKYMPDEMKNLNRSNEVSLMARIKYIDTRDEAQRILKEREQPTNGSEAGIGE
jgi:hypothetical protein